MGKKTFEGRIEGLPVINLDDGLTVAVAKTRRARRLGLSAVEAMPAKSGMLLTRCSAIHTMSMNYPLDLIWLAKNGKVLRIDLSVPRWRFKFCPEAYSVIEVNAGEGEEFAAAADARFHDPFRNLIEP